MKSRNYILFVCLAVVLASCSNEKQAEKHETPEEVALAAYNHLIKYEYEDYVKLVHSGDSITETYRQGLLATVKQFMARQNDEKKGIKSASVVDEKTVSNDNYALVMLILTYGDSTSEEVAVPVVKVNDVWRLR